MPRHVIDQLRSDPPKLAALLDEAEVDVFACANFLAERWAKIRSQPRRAPQRRITRRTNALGSFPNDDAIIRPTGAILMERDDEWAVRPARHMTLATIAPISDNPKVILSAVAA